MKMRTCTECKETVEESVDNFSLSYGRNKEKKYYRAKCKPCLNRIKRELRAGRTEEEIKRVRKRVEAQVRKRRENNPAQVKLEDVKKRARSKGLAFDLTVEDIVIPEFCPALGLRLQVNRGRVGDSSPSMDRIVPALGYVRGNVRILSDLANRIKTNATPDQVMQVALFLKEEN